jgi:hypothetical protein
VDHHDRRAPSARRPAGRPDAHGGALQGIVHVRDSTRLHPALGVPLHLVGHEFAADRTVLPARKRADVQEHRFAAAVGRDEAESLVVLPRGDPALVTHAQLRVAAGYRPLACFARSLAAM